MTDPTRPAGLGLSCAAAASATLAAGVLLAGVFRGPLALLVATACCLAGPLVVLASFRSRHPALVQYLVLPLAALGGGLLVLPSTTGGSANLPSLVLEAIRGGGLAQPPVPFEPGWRFLLVVLLTVLGAGAASLGASSDRPRLGVLVPLPVVVGAALVQPEERAALSGVLAILLMVSALVLASGAQLVQDGASSGRVEVRRLARSGGALVVLAALLVPLSQAGFLFPSDTDERVIPPTRPTVQPPLSDRVLFTVAAAPGDRGPWRLGVLDGYDGEAWLLPPYDPRRFTAVRGEGGLAGQPTSAAQTRTVTVTVGDLPGRVLPSVDGAHGVAERTISATFDPRTQTLRAADGRARAGSRYTLLAAGQPDARTLAAALPIDRAALATYLETPAMPQPVAALLAKAPRDSTFRRLQFVRAALYSAVVASGQGQPSPVPPARVAALLAGAKATPFEITAAEALLARWAGIPARIGFGYFGGQPATGGLEVHPRDGATWLEVYFPGPGWVSIVGRPIRAQASTDSALKNRDQQVRATADLALVVHVPVRLDSLRQLYEDTRYWLAVALPWLLLTILGAVFYPGALKALRSVRRRRWARRHGVAAVVLVAYAELRDRLHDLGATDTSATPLEFVGRVDYDDEHWELGWLVTRGLWGDLRRDLRAEDAAAAVAMARSVTRRTVRAQRLVVRLRGVAARGSLRDPYSPVIPNLWPRRPRRVRVRRPLLASQQAMLLAALLLLTGCGTQSPSPPPRLPERLVPAAAGGYVFQREPSAERAFTDAGSRALVTDGRVFTIRRGREVLGSIQAAQFLPEAAADRRETQRALRRSLGSGSVTRRRLGSLVVDELRSGEGRILLYFPPGGGYYELLDARAGFTDADRVFLAVLNYQTGRRTALVDTELPDPRRGGD